MGWIYFLYLYVGLYIYICLLYLINFINGCYEMSVGWFILDEMLYDLC